MGRKYPSTSENAFSLSCKPGNEQTFGSTKSGIAERLTRTPHPPPLQTWLQRSAGCSSLLWAAIHTCQATLPSQPVSSTEQQGEAAFCSSLQSPGLLQQCMAGSCPATGPAALQHSHMQGVQQSFCPILTFGSSVPFETLHFKGISWFSVFCHKNPTKTAVPKAGKCNRFFPCEELLHAELCWLWLSPSFGRTHTSRQIFPVLLSPALQSTSLW